MKLNILFFILLTLSFTKLKAQTKTITIFSRGDNQPLQNVLIYHKADIIGETDKTGKVTLQLNFVDSVTLVKNEYMDVVLAKNQLTEKVTMSRNQLIILNEVVIAPMTAKILLEKIRLFKESKDEEGVRKKQSNYDFPYNLQVYNKFMANDDTLHYLNNRFTFYNKKFKINDQIKMVKNFKNIRNKENIYQSYYWEGKETNFPMFTALTPLGIFYSVDFTDFFEHQNLFDYKIEENDAYYKLKFKQKKKTSRSNVEGYLIIDRFDYGIYEFVSKQLADKPFIINIINFSNQKSIKFKILTDTYSFKYIKEGERYILDNSNKSTTFIQEKGQNKNTLFTSTIQVEKTKNFSDKNLREFDMIKWEFK